ncbi:hypothetical protein E3V36_01285 [Candidatus Marinimicrobia bacterium MT.SAG.2]|nr:hypothetical protein E3V36_01285 [Candidatus Marinimicrobia bacterium MT.SAG.2]
MDTINVFHKKKFRLLPIGISQRDSTGGTNIYTDLSGTNGLKVLCHLFTANGQRGLMTQR